MKKSIAFPSLIALVIIIASFNCKTAPEADQLLTKPNIIYILADDLGYGEVGAFGQKKIETPHIDALANEGMRFTQHYSGSPVCAPSRCVLLTGQHTGHAYVRGNDEWGQRGKVWDYQAMFDNPLLEGQRPLPDSVVTIAELLQSAGYKTGIVGKWGLGAPTTEGVPNKQGFDFFCGYNCQRQAHNLYPMHLWKNEERILLNNKFVKLHANLKPDADPNDPKSYADFQLNDFAPDIMHQEALTFVQESGDQPFFLYYASPLPHLPLQAPAEAVAYYQNKFGPEEPFTGSSYFPNRTPRATYAAMISYLDRQVGELVSKLKELGKYDNTLIIFSSDNGPTYIGGVDAAYFESAGPFLEDYGYTKGFTYEGGIRVPTIASWPSQIKAGSTSKHISAFYDVMPTLCEVAGIDIPDHTDGISFLPEMLNQNQEAHEYLYWEFPSYTGQQAVRMGKWKAIRSNLLSRKSDIKLYDLETDIQEQNDIAAQHPDVVSKIKEIMEKEHTPAALDRFKIESLGDVKTSFLEARSRIDKLDPAPTKISLGDGYFLLSGRTGIIGSELAPKATSELQKRLQQTGGYQLKNTPNREKNVLLLKESNQIKGQNYKLECDSGKITILASSKSGFMNAIQTLLKLMDEKIWQDQEMHNPVWTIAALEIRS